jgi:SulP family sulfate permease
MVEVHNVKAVLRSTRSDAAVMIVTAAVTLAFDLILAVEIGVGVAAVLALSAVARAASPQVEEPESRVDADTEHELLHEHIVTYRLDGALFFGAAQRFLTELTAVTNARVVILRLDAVRVLDATGAHTLGEIVCELEGRHVTVILAGVRPEHRRILAAVGTFDHLAHERHLFDDVGDAIEHARAHVRRGLHDASDAGASTGVAAPA